MPKRQETQVYEDRYKIINGERGEFSHLCVYCGLPADTRDHVPPISRVSDYESLGLNVEIYIKVPACSECNTLLGDSIQNSFMERAEELKNKLSRKFSRQLANIDWEEDEINDLGPNLRSYVKSSVRNGKTIVKRIDYYYGVDSVSEQISDMVHNYSALRR